MPFRLLKGPSASVSLFSLDDLGVVELGLNDYFVGDDVTQDWTLVNKTFEETNKVSQVGDSFPRKSTGEVTGSGADIHLSVAPADTVPIIFPPQIIASILGESIFFVGDISDDLLTTRYQGLVVDSDEIKVYFTDRAPDHSIAEPAWLQLAPLVDADMTIGTYEAAGDPLFLPKPIKATGTIDLVDASIDDFGVFVTTDDWLAGQLVIIGLENAPDFDIVWVTLAEDLGFAWSLTFWPQLNHNHLIGTSVFACANGFAMKSTLPALPTYPTNIFNISTDTDYEPIAR